jgi:hypothetical protein
MATVHALRSVKPPVGNRTYGLGANPAKLRRYALHLLALIESNFANQPIFTRECVRWLDEHKRLYIFPNRVDLSLPANKHVVHQPLDASYIQTVARLISEYDKPQFDLNDILLTWKSDQLLTTGTKRTVLRACMHRLVRAGSLNQIDDFTYSVDTDIDQDDRRQR